MTDVYISIDMEGVAGIATMDQVSRGGHGYARAQRLMTAEANAAIEGAFAAGARSVLVNDSHGAMDNLLHEELDPRARLIFGTPKLDCMAEGISAEHDVALFLGYHAAAGSPGVLAHTFSSHFPEVRLNGAIVSEAEVNALQAAAVGVPVGLLTGDDVICGVAGKALPGVRTVAVKIAHGHTAADSLSPVAARRLIKEAAAETVRSAGGLRPVELPGVLELEIDMPTTPAAELGELVPGVRRIADKTLAATFATPREVLGCVTTCSHLAADAMIARMALYGRPTR
ncbi:M55 family metallopeptidase [Nonomuraea sp. SMC257]|uniref:M55 family metallopeptidase n=1 Tax=Nonomuraea montanisoli TaxID=2741721 RepID=A0A7Y6M5T9_9ACTN|nr:M55 family metallopeptidase [Nonomuraea montanisoli]NUW34654.1 M55 family metallopeptidase [Nonomuraea montanisoli]